MTETHWIWFVVILLWSNILTCLIAHKLGYRSGVRVERWRWTITQKVEKIPFSGLFY